MSTLEEYDSEVPSTYSTYANPLFEILEMIGIPEENYNEVHLKQIIQAPIFETKKLASEVYGGIEKYNSYIKTVKKEECLSLSAYYYNFFVTLIK